MASAASESRIVIKAQDEASATVDRLHAKLLGLQNPMGGMYRNLTKIANHSSMKGLGESVQVLNNKLASAGLGIGIGAAGLAVGAAGAFNSVVKTAEAADRIGDLGGRLQLNAEQFQVLEKLAKDADASVEEVGGAFMKFRLNLQQAESEGGEKLAKMQKALGSFGMSFDQARAMQPLELAKVLGRISFESKTDADQELKIQKFRDLFGKTGATLIPVIESVGTSYNETLAKMTKAGVLFTDQQVEGAGAAFKKYEKAQQAMQGLNRVFGLAMQPAFEKLSDVLYDRAVSNRNALAPVFKELGDSLTKNIEPILDGLASLVKGASTTVKALAWMFEAVGAGNVMLAAGTLIAAPFVNALFGVAVSLYKVGAFFATPLLSWLATTTAGTYALGIAAKVAWGSFLLPVTAVVAAIGLVWANLDDIGNYFNGISKRVEQATDRLGVFGGVGQMIFELLTAAINALIGSLNTVLDLLAKVGIGSGGKFGFVGDAKSEYQQRVVGNAWGNEVRYAIPATSPATLSRQEVSGQVTVRLEKGLAPAEVQSNSRNFDIQAFGGGMFGLGM